ncbi:MAG: aspartate kinase [Oscillospiraceae bacterium]
MALIVQKFGGSSVRDRDRIFNVARIVANTYNSGNDVAVVVSAQGDTTDDLLQKAGEITHKPNTREMDVLLSSGEQISMALLAMALGELGCPAVSLTGWQAGFETNRAHGRARIKNLEGERIAAELAKRRIVIVAGFQGININGDITTLGRGGSDTSAVAIAAALQADRCQIFTDVDGVYTADPRIVPNAVKLEVISFDEMLELATLGAQVLNNRSVELAKKYGVELEVLSSLNPVPGTIVKEVYDMNEGMLIKGVAKDTHVAVISILDVPDVPGISFKIFGLMGQKKINVDIILQSSGREGNKDVIFTVPAEDAESARQILLENLDRFGGKEVLVDTGVAKVSVVGAGMQSHAGVAAKMFEALYEANVNVRMITTSEIKISVLIDREETDRAVTAIHSAFMDTLVP